MKKIGILFGQENTFPQAFIDRINAKKIDGIMAEAVSIDKVAQGKPTDYAVIIDRISQDVPFYRAYLKNAAIGGTAVINNPFWWSADEKFFNNALAMSVGVAVPNTVILPSHERPTDTNENSFRNLKFPINWQRIFDYVGFPAYMKPHAGGGWKSVYRVEDAADLFKKHAETAQLVMMLQEEIEFTEYFRCYYLGGDRVHIMQYEPRNPHHLRYVLDGPPVKKEILDKVKEGVLKLNHALGYDFNTVEFAVRDGVPYAIDFCNPAPDADVHSVGEANFEWIVENAANMAIERAKAQKPGQLNLTWGSFIKDQVLGSDKNLGKASANKKAVKPLAKTKAPKAADALKKTGKQNAKAPLAEAATKPVKSALKSSSKNADQPKGLPQVKRGEPSADDAPQRMMEPEAGTKKVKPMMSKATEIKKATAKNSLDSKRTAAKKSAAPETGKSKLSGNKKAK